MSSEKRKYELRARALRQAETRDRIIAATSELHEEVGPARTTVTEIARRAGVQRLTVYKHFPVERELFAACSEHWRSGHPLPDLTPAFQSADPADRLGAVLRLMYQWYRTNQAMAGNVQRDRLSLPALDSVLREGADAQATLLASTLAEGFAPRGSIAKRQRAMLALALNFWTWRRLTEEGFSDPEAADLMVRSVVAVA